MKSNFLRKLNFSARITVFNEMGKFICMQWLSAMNYESKEGTGGLHGHFAYLCNILMGSGHAVICTYRVFCLTVSRYNPDVKPGVSLSNRRWCHANYLRFNGAISRLMTHFRLNDMNSGLKTSLPVFMKLINCLTNVLEYV